MERAVGACESSGCERETVGNSMEQKRTMSGDTGIKICGITSAEEAAWVAEEQVDYAGVVVFYQKSRRNRTIEEAETILPVLKQGRALSGGAILTVAVTVSPAPDQIAEIQEAGFDRIQVHGELSKAAFDAIDIPMIRAFNGFDRKLYERVCHCGKVEACLFDAGTPGSGRTFDWESLKRLPRDKKPIFLAGGLTPDNVAQAIRKVRPDVVDVSSGVEKDTKDGKDREKIRAFVRAVRNITEE